VHSGAIDGGTKSHAVLIDTAHLRQAEHLETAGVGEYRRPPAHETVQAILMQRNDPGTRPQHQMKRIAQYDARPERREFLGQDGLHRAVGAHGHEDRGLDHAMRQSQPPEASHAIARQQFEHAQARACGAADTSMASP